MWLARDGSGTLYYFYVKPTRSTFGRGLWVHPIPTNYYEGFCERLKDDIFPEITWETEPTWKRIVLKEWIYVDSPRKTD